MKLFTVIAGMTAAVLLVCTGCDEGPSSEAPSPAALTRDAVGHYCGMIVADHNGPKAQIHLEGSDEVIWFTSVRDAVSFTRLPEEPKNIAAFYVHDVGKAESWDHPGEQSWIKAGEAVYVIGSSRRGGMGALEAVPFSQQAAAEAFAAQYGGHLAALEDIPDDYVLGDDAAPGMSKEAPGMSHHMNMSPAAGEKH